MTPNYGGPACSKCTDIAVRKQGHQLLCAIHYRFQQMRCCAKRRGKRVPSYEELESLRSDNCPDCGRKIVWLSEQSQDRVASFQHYRDGTSAIVCRSCNTRHAFMPSDSYRDMPKDHKRCPQCEVIKPFSEFHADRGRSGVIKLKSWCKACSSASHAEWQQKNRSHYNAKQREGRRNRAMLAAREGDKA